MIAEVLKASVFYLFILSFIPVGGDWYWFDGWIWCITFVTAISLIHIYLYRKDPELLRERARMSAKDQLPIDKTLRKALRFFLLLWFLIVPLEVKRFEWSTSVRWMQFHPVFKWSAFSLTFPALYLLFRAYSDCTYLSPMLRIQKERKQRVIDTGAYGMVRHPMYSAAIQFFLFSSIFFRSFCGTVVILCGGVLLFVRIGYEEEMLLKGLDGYKEYRKRVKYKLVPFLI